jgi:hypothetical protein
MGCVPIFAISFCHHNPCADAYMTPFDSSGTSPTTRPPSTLFARSKTLKKLPGSCWTMRLPTIRPTTCPSWWSGSSRRSYIASGEEIVLCVCVCARVLEGPSLVLCSLVNQYVNNVSRTVQLHLEETRKHSHSGKDGKTGFTVSVSWA